MGRLFSDFAIVHDVNFSLFRTLISVFKQFCTPDSVRFGESVDLFLQIIVK